MVIMFRNRGVTNLTELTIEGYKSPRYPTSWLPLQNLRSLQFDNCAALEVLPPINNLFPHCNELTITKFSKLRKFLSLPQSLNELVIVDCPSLIIVSEDEVQKSDDDIKNFIMTTMRSYQLINRELNAEEVARDCLKVKRLLESEKVNVPEDFMALATILQSWEKRDDLNLWEAYCHIQEQRLEVIFGRREKNELILPSSLQTLCLWNSNITDGALSQSLQGLTCLKSLSLLNISAITTLPAEGILHHLSVLTELYIDGCPWLKSLGGLYALTSLEKLNIENCPCLELEMVTPLPLSGEGGGGRCILPPSLRRLWMLGITTMKSFVVAVRYLPNLASLSVSDCPSLASLSLSHLTSLTWLEITRCPKLERLYLDSCPSISSLPEDLPESLKELKLWNCPTISLLPEKLPESLGQIEIINGPVLEVRCRSPNGEDWPKIAHIPRRIISRSKMHACLKLLCFG